MSLLDTTPAARLQPQQANGASPEGPVTSRGDRVTSWDVADFPTPHGREEEWRFTPVDRIGTLLTEGATDGTLVWETTLPDGVTLTEISHERARELGAKAPGDRPAALAVANSTGALHLDISKELELEQPVRVVLRGQGDAPVFGHVVVTTGRHSRATVIVDHQGHAEVSELVSVITGDGSDLTLVSVQDWDDTTLHLSEQDIHVGRDATVKQIAVTLGGKVVRLSTNATYAGPGGSFEGFGVYFADAGQHLEHRLLVDHEQPHCRSEVEYKGALQGEGAHTVWIGDVLIRAAAEGTDTYELNRNLILTDGARADSVPNLEIETGEITGAGHASTTGRFDDEQLFYLMSRGVPEDDARRLVVRGFFASIVSRIGVPEIIGHVMSVIDAELEASPL
ncbi:Fe-S cluster assembly protein SufD [Kribbia dieselivorans]|uniref:Fe-S cluster assembly protein SufD n=1 Tax=Kribbia dieselivorans TaxID=331526 RepID=UPI0008396181|nr:Fe-S cluster assembly protein SufD [Kribbia dieselivorans]